MITFRVTVPPAAEPISVTEAEAHLRIDVTDSGTPGRIGTAREQAEAETWKALVLQTIEERRDCFPGVILPLRSPVRAVDSVKYIDTNGDLQTLATTLWQADLYHEPARILPAYGESWPSTRGDPGAVRITYRAGIAVPFTAVAATDVITATGHWFADNDPVPVWNTGGALPAGLSQGTYYARDVVAGVSFKLAATSGGAAIDITGTGTGTHFAGAELPFVIRAGMLLVIGHLDANREQVITGAAPIEIPMGAQHLFAMERVHGY